jgi:glyoxylase-like metal-dependent hydrolase (beta-lactamase superfamily II)
MEVPMHRLISVLLVALGAGAASVVMPLLPATAALARSAAAADPPELAYLKQVNAWRPPSDPQLVFLLMAQFANAGRHAEGIAYIEETMQRFSLRLDDTQRALYLTALASLRAGHAQQVFVLRRFGWVRDTVQMLDQAKQLTHDQVFVVRWMSGVVRAQLPGFFGERRQAIDDLRWCEANAAKAPHPAWLREVYHRLAALERDAGNTASAQRHQTLSGLPDDPAPVVFTTPFSEDRKDGHAFSPRSVRAIVPGTVYQLSGFEFTEFYFVVSADRRELVAIDAGTRADSARAALEALRAQTLGLPPLTTVLVTHAHWDHVGGQRYFRSLQPQPRFIGRANYRDELAHNAMGDPNTLTRFFGQDFKLDDVMAYRPDATIDGPTELTVGGTRFVLLPTHGGETDDAMLIHLPDAGVLFAGDILMPYLGAPFLEEGSLEGLIAAIDQVHAIAPQRLLHGHEPLNPLFPSVRMLDDLRNQLVWLQSEVLQRVRAGAERGAIQAANLMPPALQASDSSVHLAYLVLRENAINRTFDRQSGYWQNGLQGLDNLTDADRGTALVDYLGVNESQLVRAAERLVADGRHELAAALLRWTEPRFAGRAQFEATRKLAYLKLMEKYQAFNPFKFILYAGEIDRPVAPIAPPQTAAPRP